MSNLLFFCSIKQNATANLAQLLLVAPLPLIDMAASAGFGLIA
jgi:hypothetical protein